MKFEELPFVGQDSGGEYPKVMPWQPVRTEDYSKDCAQGRAYFKELHDLVVQNHNPTLLSRVLGAQIAGGVWDGVEIGFSQAMGETLILASLA